MIYSSINSISMVNETNQAPDSFELDVTAFLKINR